MANRKNSRNDRMTPGFNPEREKRFKYGQGRKDAFGEVQYSQEPRVAQGTLFSHKALMNLPGNAEAKRQKVGHRGYSKARLDEVRGAIGTDYQGKPKNLLRIDQRKAEDYEVEGGRGYKHGSAHWMPNVSEDESMYGAPYGIKGEVEHDYSAGHGHTRWAKQGMARMLGTLSRSTMPAEHLQGLSHINVEPKHPEWGGSYHYDYKGEKDPTYRTGHRVNLYAPGHSDTSASRADQEVTVMHELGHHWSHVHSGQYGGYGTAEEQGKEEAKADSYALRHWRQDPRDKPEYGTQFDPREHTYGARGQTAKFGGAYKLAARDVAVPSKSHLPAGQLASEQAKNQPMLDMHLDTPVFTQRPKDVSHETTDVPLQSGETRRGWTKTTKEAGWFAQVPHQEAIYRHEAFRNTQRENRRDEARSRQEISQRWGVGRQFR